MHYNLYKQAFITQKDNAKKRKIEFCFAYEEWVAWWEANLGPDWFKKRGCRRGQYVMARNGDKGPYAAGNVRCVTTEINKKEQAANGLSGIKKGQMVGEKHHQARLCEQDIKTLRTSKLNPHVLAKQFAIDVVSVKRIQRGDSWKHLNYKYPPI